LRPSSTPEFQAARSSLFAFEHCDCLTMASTKGEVTPIAIVGMSCRLPGEVMSLDDFWRLMCRSRNGWSKIPGDRFNKDAYHHPNAEKTGSINSEGGYFLKQDLSLFDAPFFRITKEEAQAMGEF
jgi:acyl transferase domain-containing protein